MTNDALTSSAQHLACALLAQTLLAHELAHELAQGRDTTPELIALCLLRAAEGQKLAAKQASLAQQGTSN